MILANFTILVIIAKYFCMAKIFNTDLRCVIEYNAHSLTLKMMLEIFLARSTWRVADKGFKLTFMIITIAIFSSCEIIIEK